MSLKTELIIVKPREKVGARTGARYAFQAHVAFSKLINLHKAGGDYRALFDSFDDLVVLDSSFDPKNAWFYQIKGKESGTWTPTPFCNSKGKAPSTIIGKMYDHSQKFPTSLKEAVFVSNAAYSFKLAGKGKTGVDNIRIALNELDLEEKNKFSVALDKDFAPPRDPNEETLIWFEVTPIPIKNYEHAIKGQLVDFLEFESGSKIAGVYRTLIGEIEKKAACTTEFTEIEDLYSEKSLCRNDLEAVFESAKGHVALLENWQLVAADLKNLGSSTMQIIKLQTALITYTRGRAIGDAKIIALSDKLKEEIVNNGVVSDQVDLVNDAMKVSKQIPTSFGGQYATELILAAALLEIFEAPNGT